MPRQPRFFMDGQPLHVIQRGNDREAMFRAHGDYQLFLSYFREASQKHGVAVHAYVAMTNHVHLLVTPTTAQSVPRMMQAIGRRYVPWFNDTYERTGTLWEGRYRASVVDSDRYLLACMRYIELNPVRANLVSQPQDYRYSSYAANALGARTTLVQPHDLYLSLGESDHARHAAYRALFDRQVPHDDVAAIRKATHNNWVLGSDAFGRHIETLSRRPAAPVKRGRHPKATPVPCVSQSGN